MILAFEILVAVDGALMLAWATLMGFEVPLDADPDVIARLRIVEYLSDVPDGAHELHMLRCSILVKQMLLWLRILDAKPLSQQVLVLWRCLRLLDVAGGLLLWN